MELGDVTVANLLDFFGRLPVQVRSHMLLLVLLVIGKFTLLPLGFMAAILTLNMFRQEATTQHLLLQVHATHRG